MKIAYHYDWQTRLFTSTSNVYQCTGYKHYILPQLSTWVEVPELNGDTQQCRYQPEQNAWLVEAKLVEVTAYHKQTQGEKTFGDASLLTGEYTLAKPTTQFDEWINDAWITNLSNKYIADYDAVDSTRRALYREVSDPLYMESYRKKESGEFEKAAIFKAQADAAVEQIQIKNPFPTSPINLP